MTKIGKINFLEEISKYNTKDFEEFLHSKTKPIKPLIVCFRLKRKEEDKNEI